MDDLVGRTRAALREGDTLLVMSDHGFTSFRRGVELNAWLREQGYLALKGDARESDMPYLAEIDWSRTRAYAIGLAGLYLNQRDREGEGIVGDGGERDALLAELKAKLTGLRDQERGEIAIREAVVRDEVYHGPYAPEGPDLIIGYAPGYRVAWGAATGRTGPGAFIDNTKAWSGDHCVHPAAVPGVLFSNRKLKPEAKIIDLAPTVLDLLGVDRPAYLDGHSLLCDEPR
jgi:predicted AlkP superfamily phosphohydrolase/phosphomutase